LVQEIQQYTTRKPEVAVGELNVCKLFLKYYYFLFFYVQLIYYSPYNYNILFILFGDLVGNN